MSRQKRSFISKVIVLCMLVGLFGNVGSTVYGTPVEESGVFSTDYEKLVSPSFGESVRLSFATDDGSIFVMYDNTSKFTYLMNSNTGEVKSLGDKGIPQSINSDGSVIAFRFNISGVAEVYKNGDFVQVTEKNNFYNQKISFDGKYMYYLVEGPAYEVHRVNLATMSKETVFKAPSATPFIREIILDRQGGVAVFTSAESTLTSSSVSNLFYVKDGSSVSIASNNTKFGDKADSFFNMLGFSGNNLVVMKKQSNNKYRAYSIDVTTKAVSKFGSDPGTPYYAAAKLSPDGNTFAYFAGNMAFIEDVSTGMITTPGYNMIASNLSVGSAALNLTNNGFIYSEYRNNQYYIFDYKEAFTSGIRKRGLDLSVKASAAYKGAKVQFSKITGATQYRVVKNNSNILTLDGTSAENTVKLDGPVNVYFIDTSISAGNGATYTVTAYNGSDIIEDSTVTVDFKLPTYVLGNKKVKAGDKVLLGGIYWRVLEDNVLVLDRADSTKRQFSESSTNFNIADSKSLAYYLNTEFYNAYFDDTEKAAIKRNLYKNYRYTYNKYSTSLPIVTKTDLFTTVNANVGLLSVEQLEQSQDLSLTNNSDPIWIMNSYTDNQVLYYDPSSVNKFDYDPPTSTKMVRPIIYIQPNATFSGSGTVEDPYVFDGMGAPKLESPKNLNASDITTDTVTLSWDPVSGATGYQVERNGSILGTITSTSYKNEGLLAGTEYTYNVYAMNDKTPSEPASVNVKTMDIVVPAPTGFKVVEINHDKISLSWDPGDYDGFVLKRDGKTISSPNSTSFTDTQVNQETSYSYSLQGIKSGVQSVAVTLDVTTPKKVLQTPVVTVTGVTYKAVDIFWEDVPEATTYTVFLNGEPAEAANLTQTAWSAKDLEPGTEYVFGVVASSNNATSEMGTATAKTKTLEEMIPEVDPSVELRVVEVGTDFIHLAFTPIKGAKVNVIKRNNKVIFEGTELEFRDEGLSPGKKYTYSLQGKNEFGLSSSVIESVETVGVAPQVPQGLKAVRVTKSSASLQWHFVSDAETYKLIRDDQVLVFEGNRTAFRDNTLSPKETYTYKVIATNKWGESQSEEITVTTLEELSTIVIVPSQDPKEGSVTFEIKVVPAADFYYVERNPEWTYKRTDKSGIWQVQYYNTATGETRDFGFVIEKDGHIPFIEEGVDPSKDYHYSVTAVTRDGEVIGGDEIEVTTPDDGSGATVPGDGQGNNGGDNGTGDNGGNTGGNNGGDAGSGNTGGESNSGDNGTGGSSGGNNGSGGSSSGGSSDGSSDGTGSGSTEDGGSSKETENKDSENGNGENKGSGANDQNVGSESPFTDLQSWNKDKIDYLYAKGIIKGVGPSKFDSNREVTRAEFAILLARALEVSVDDKYTSKFEDLDPKAWYAKELPKALSNGLAKGFSEKEFKPAAVIPREQAAKMVSYVLLDSLGSYPSFEGVKMFSDDKDVIAWAKNDVYLAAKEGIIKDYPDGSYKPKKKVTRAEAAVIIYNLVKYLE